MKANIIGTCEYQGREFGVKAIPFALFREALEVEKGSDPCAKADMTKRIVEACLIPQDGKPFDLGGYPWNDMVELSKLPMARPEGAGPVFTIKPAS